MLVGYLDVAPITHVNFEVKAANRACNLVDARVHSANRQCALFGDVDSAAHDGVNAHFGLKCLTVVLTYSVTEQGAKAFG